MCGRCLQGYGSAAGGAPWGADGYSGQQGGEAARPNRRCRLPSLLAAMGGRGYLREGSHTSLASHSRKPTRQGRVLGGCGRIISGRCLQGYGSAAGGAPWGADGYSGQQGGEAARPNRLCRLPSLLAAMGGRGDLREGSHTSLSSHSRNKFNIYKSKSANLQIKMCIFASNNNEII